MLQFKTLCVPAVFLSLASLAQAQTGPSGPVAPPSPAPAPANGAVSRLTPDSLVAYLRSQAGFTVEMKGQNIVAATIRRDGWTYVVEVHFTANGKFFALISPLGQASSQFASAQLLELLKASRRLAPAHFTYRDADQRLCLEDHDYGTQISESQFLNILDGYLKTVRDTYSLWDTSRWPVAGPAPTSGPGA